MIIAPYKFQGHGGWQGTSHPSVFKDGDQYYIAHQGRPGVDKYYMVLHVRKLFWTEDGWPVASPERFANVEETPIEQSELIGDWDQIVFGYQVVPGYAEEQLSPNFQESILLQLNDDGKINGDAANQWTYGSPWLTLTWGNGHTDKMYVSRERDWENKIESTIVFSGLNNEGTAVWGRKRK
jgi:arabinan endo-1,5-alpha-L-arabinosidase